MQKLATTNTFLKTYKYDALLKQKNCCAYCFEPLKLQNATTDHVVAKSNGGNNKRENVLAVCYHCNQTKRSLTLKEFLKKVETSFDLNFILIRNRRIIWKATHITCHNISKYVGIDYFAPNKKEMKNCLN